MTQRTLLRAFRTLYKQYLPFEQSGGLYVGIVVRDDDPQDLSRYKVFIPALQDPKLIEKLLAPNGVAQVVEKTQGLGFFNFSLVNVLVRKLFNTENAVKLVDVNKLPWAYAQITGSPRGGLNIHYRNGDQVLVHFQNGDTQYPVITGSYYSGQEQPVSKAEKVAQAATPPGSIPPTSSSPLKEYFTGLGQSPSKKAVYDCLREVEQFLGIPQDRLAAIAWQESSMNVNAVNSSSIELSISAFQVNQDAHPSFMYGGPIVTKGPIIAERERVRAEQGKPFDAVEKSVRDWQEITGANSNAAGELRSRFEEAGGKIGVESPGVATNCPYSALFAGCYYVVQYKLALKAGYKGDAAWTQAYVGYNGGTPTSTHPGALAYAKSAESHYQNKPWKGATATVASNASPSSTASPAKRPSSVFSFVEGLGSSKYGSNVGDGISHRRIYHESEPNVQAYTSPEGHKLIFHDGYPEDDPNDKRTNIGNEGILLQSIFGHRLLFVDRPISHRRIEIDTVGGQFIRMFEGDGSDSYIQIQDAKGNVIILRSTDDELLVQTAKKITMKTKQVRVEAADLFHVLSQKIILEAPKITLRSRDIRLGSDTASRELGLRGTKDTAGQPLVDDLSTAVRSI